MPKCNHCNQNIEFVYDKKYERWLRVEPYEIDSSERLSRQQKIPIPYDPYKHEKHYPNCRGAQNDK